MRKAMTTKETLARIALAANAYQNGKILASEAWRIASRALDLDGKNCPERSPDALRKAALEKEDFRLTGKPRLGGKKRRATQTSAFPTRCVQNALNLAGIDGREKVESVLLGDGIAEIQTEQFKITIEERR